MRSLYVCVIHEHDARLLILAVIVCVLGVYAAFGLGARAVAQDKPAERLKWAMTCILSASSGIWATHFIAMLAFRPGTQVGFRADLTVISYVIAVLLIGVGTLGIVYARRRVARASAGLVVGIGISLMHYVGMMAYEVAGTVSWDRASIACSVAANLVLCVAASLAGWSHRRSLRAAAPPLLLLSVYVLHLVGMSAMTIAADPRLTLSADALSPALMSKAVAIAALLVAGLAATSLWLDRRARLRRRRDHDRLRDLTDIAMEGLLICDGEQIVTANGSFETLSGMHRDELTQQAFSSLLEGLVLEMVPEIVETDAVLTRADGVRVPVRVLRRGMMMDGRLHAVVAVRDQRGRLQMEAEFRTLACTDSLTGLPNRAHFNSTLQQAGACRPPGCGFAVLMLDLDRFKIVNDTLGHPVGDLLLQRVATRLRRCVRSADIVSRLGGDEFVVLQADVVDTEQTCKLAARIVEVLSRPFLLDGRVVNIGASVGIAFCPSDGEEADLLLRNADLALYKAKSDGRAAFRVFEPDLDLRMNARRELEMDLRRAIVRHEFVLHYQPLVDARSGDLVGAEALIRWHDPQRGLVSPAGFIPLAEETGLITAIGQWVLRTACKEAAAWPCHLCIAVNLSPVQFREPRLEGMVRDVLTSTGLAPSRLELEITEGVLITDEAKTLVLLNELRSLGVRICMDDFGTGYSSLSSLHRFPFDKIKIDGSFIRQVPESSATIAMIKAIITMGACLGMRTTVEGVETMAQLAFTKASGCDQMQGYVVGRPMTANAFRDFLQVKVAA